MCARNLCRPGESSPRERLIPWERACRILETMFKRLGADTFPNVSIGEGYAHTAFATGRRAIIVQAYLGKAHVMRQCHQLRTLHERLHENEPSSPVLAALYFPIDTEHMPKPKGIVCISPRNLTTLRRFLIGGQERMSGVIG